MNNAFMQYVFSGLSFRAYAARFKITVPTLLRAITGITELPPQLDSHEVRAVLRPSHTEFLYVAMKGPRGSVRWHQWHVEQEVALSILQDENDFHRECREEGRLHVFTTVDNLVVAINPQHMVTAMYGPEDTRFVEQRALVHSHLVSGDAYLPESQATVLQALHDQLKRAAEDLPPNDDDFQVDSLSQYPGYKDRRPSLAYLRDLKAPFQDNLYEVGSLAHITDEDTISSHLAFAFNLGEKICLPARAMITDRDDTQIQTLLPLDQTSVLQDSRWGVQRFALYAFVEGVESNTLERDTGYYDPLAARANCHDMGLFGADEIESFAALFARAAEKAAPPPKRRGRPRTKPAPVEVLDS